MARESNRRAVKKYQAEKTRQYCFRLVIGKDDDVIEALDSAPSKVGLVRRLVRGYVKKENA